MLKYRYKYIHTRYIERRHYGRFTYRTLVPWAYGESYAHDNRVHQKSRRCYRVIRCAYSSSSANPVILELVGQKPHIVLLNKVDLADPKATKEWTEFFTQQGITVLAIDSKSGKGNKKLVSTVERLSKPIIDRWVAKGIRSRSIRTIILGIPNVGKSTLINSLAGSAATRTANKAGHTRGQQWVKIGKNMELLDTPGVLWPKLEDQRVAASSCYDRCYL